jgi:hypothetical protein
MIGTDILLTTAGLPLVLGGFGSLAAAFVAVMLISMIVYAPGPQAGVARQADEVAG